MCQVRILANGLRLLTPAINKNLGAIVSGKSFGVVHCLPWQLGESLAGHHGAALLLTETVLLAVCSIPDPVNEEVRCKKECKKEAIPVVLRGVVVCQVDGAVAVAERHTSQVPENQHEAPFFVVHIPVSCQRTLFGGNTSISNGLPS